MGAWVYFVQAENAGLIKIGHTRTDPAEMHEALIRHPNVAPLIALAYRDHR